MYVILCPIFLSLLFDISLWKTKIRYLNPPKRSRRFLPNGEVEYELSKCSKDSNPDFFLSVRSLCAVALLPCLLACFADCLASTSRMKERYLTDLFVL